MDGHHSDPMSENDQDNEDDVYIDWSDIDWLSGLAFSYYASDVMNCFC